MPTAVSFDADYQAFCDKIRNYQDRGLRAMLTSSFQSNSVVLLHFLYRSGFELPVYFLQTGYHFAETLIFRDKLVREWKLDIRNLRSEVPRHQQRDHQGRLLYHADPDACCRLNKVAPMKEVLATHDVWISGLRAGQNEHRAQMEPETRGTSGILRYLPLLSWSRRDVFAYLRHYALPRHPLDGHGYTSIGCMPCTQKVRLSDYTDAEEDRSGRWNGQHKTECGLHTEL